MLSGARTAVMKSYPGIITRVLRETASRALRSTQVAPAFGPSQREAASAHGLLRAAAPRHGRKDGDDGDVLRRWGGLCVAAATAVTVGAHEQAASAASSAAAAGGTIQQHQPTQRALISTIEELPLPSSIGELPVERHAVADAVESASPWVVNVVSGAGISSDSGGAMKWGAGSLRNMGSGFIISGDGLVVTNAHVVERFTDGTVVITLDGGEKLKGKVQAMDRKFDLALVKVDVPPGVSLPVARIGRSTTLRAGEFVVAMGSPQGLAKSCTLGIVSATARSRSELVADARTETIMSDSADFIQMDAAIASGNSGGPLIDLDGKVIGINTLKLSGTEGVGFAIPIDTAWQVIEELRTQGRVDRPQLGMRLVTIDNRKGKQNGVMILSVTPGGAADRAGLRFGDLITEFDGKAITNATEVLQGIGQQVGRAIPMTVIAAISDHPESELPPARCLTVVTESDRPTSPTASPSPGSSSGSRSPPSSSPSQGAAAASTATLTAA